MLQAQGFSAWITIGDVESEEYTVEVSEGGRRVACWIASDVGKAFAINWRATAPPGPTGGWAIIDGTPLDGRLTRPEDRATHQHKLDSVRISATSSRALVFSPIELTDDDSYLGSKCGDVGQISLKIWRIEYGGITHAPLQVTTFITSLDKKIHERSKKAGGHQIQLGEEKATPPHAAIGYRVLDRDPWVTFEFKYRPLDILRANDIAPLPPSKRKASRSPARGPDLEPKPEEIEDAEDLGAEEARLLERLKEIQGRRARVGLNSRKKVKTEERGAVFVSGEIIDLT